MAVHFPLRSAHARCTFIVGALGVRGWRRDAKWGRHMAGAGGVHEGHGSLEALREVIIVAALHYRDAMRRYQAEQAEAIAGGLGLEELVAGNWKSYVAAARAEEQLFALLDGYNEREAAVRNEAQNARRDP
jgi:hypothetical protein